MLRRLTAIFDAMALACLYGLRLALSLTIVAPYSHGQLSYNPGTRDTVLDRPEYQGRPARAPVPAADHVRNECGSLKAQDGLCVPSSILSNGLAQGVPGLNVPGRGTSNVPGNWSQIDDAPGKGSKFWRTVKSRPGGYWPTRLDNLLKELYGQGEAVPYGAHYMCVMDDRPELLDSLSAKGYPLALTTDNGSHMISYDHWDMHGVSIYHDNNAPGIWHAVPARTALARSIDRASQKYFLFVWTDRPRGSIAGAATDPQAIAIGVLGLTVVVLVVRRRKQAALELELAA